MVETLGTYLREQRVQRGLTLEAIATETRVPLQYLQGLEEDDLSKLPGAIVLAKAYLRSYIRCLRLPAAVEDRAMAYLVEIMVAARQDPEPAAADVRSGPLAAVIDLYYGIVVTWTLRREQGLEAMLYRSSVVGQNMRALVAVAQSWARTVRHMLGLLITAMARQATRDLMRAVDILTLRLTTARQACLRWALSATQPVVGVGASFAQTGAHLSVSLLRAAGWLTVSMPRSGLRVIGSLVNRALGQGRAILTGIGRGRVAAAETINAHRQRFRAKTSRLVTAGVGGVASGVSASITSILSLVSLLWSISILSLIAFARAFSRASSHAIVAVGHLYEFVRHSTYLPQPVAPVGMDAWWEAGARAAVSKSEPPVRHSYLTSTLMPPGSQHRAGGPNDRPRDSGQLSFRERSSREKLKLGAWDMRSWYWVANYVVALTLAVVLASILGDAPLFKGTMLGDTSLNASRLVQFIGFGASLLLFWLLGLRVAAQIPDAPLLPAIIRRLMTPLVTLVTLSGLYKILLLIGDPFLTKSSRQLYDWAFVILIMASAAWVTMAGFWMVHSTKQAAESAREGELEIGTDSDYDCPHCHTPVDGDMRFCGYCGSSIS